MEQQGAYGVVLNAELTNDGAFGLVQDWDVVMRTNLDGFYNVLHPGDDADDSAARGRAYRVHPRRYRA